LRQVHTASERNSHELSEAPVQGCTPRPQLSSGLTNFLWPRDRFVVTTVPL
jgi:hypothetical protein